MSGGRPRLRPILVAVGIILVLLLTSTWIATRAVFFVGSDDDGFVTVFNGVPYDLPGGVPLYSASFKSGLPARALPPPDRELVTTHEWRSQDEALAVVRRLERSNRGPLEVP